MSAAEHFDATHRVVARSDDRVAACKRALVAALRRDASEVRVLVHATQEGSAPDAVESLDPVENERAEFADEDETELVGTLPEADAAVDAVLAAMKASGGFPLTALGLRGPDYDSYVTASRSHGHVAKLRVGDETRLDAVREAVAPDGLVVPEGPVAAWEMDDRYVEIAVHELCVYAEPVADLDREERMSVTHHCHDLTDLRGVVADETAHRFVLEWAAGESLVGRLLRAVFGRPPAELSVPPEQFDAVGGYLEQFVDGPG